MSLQTLRLNPNKRRAFLSDCFYFNWLGKYSVEIDFLKDSYKVVCRNFTFHSDECELPYCVSHFNQYDIYHFTDIKRCIDFYKLVCYTLISDFDIKSISDFDEFFDLTRPQGAFEYLPQIKKYFM